MKICVKYLQHDDAGESIVLEKEYKQQNLEINFGYNNHCTSQRNGKVEKKIKTLNGKIRAILNDAGFDGKF
jgi:hypothetical protein